jgi:hypothetical protein
MFRRIASFWLGFFAAVVGYAIVNVYALDYYEPHWGRSISLQVSIWLAAILALIGVAGFAAGLRVFRAAPTLRLSAAAGIAAAAGSLLVAAIVDRTMGGYLSREFISVSSVFVFSLLSVSLFRAKRNASA